MSHPFGDLLHQHLHRKQGLTQSRLAEGILQDPAVISNMCRGRRLAGKQARERVMAIIGWLHTQEVLSTRAEADALLNAAGLAPLQSAVPKEAELLAELAPDMLPTAVPSNSRYLTNVPAQLTSFVGREAALQEVGSLISRQRLVTLVGVGGIGKTRLATECGIGIVQGEAPISFADGVWFAPLASLNEPTLLAESIVRSLPQIPGVGESALETLVDYLADKEMLLILDNCEHLIDHTARLVEALLQRCWRLRVLATSREALRIPGELTLSVDPLTVAGNGTSTDSPVAAAPRLFLERVRTLRPDMRPTSIELEIVDRICRRLDGIPLALELAASRVVEAPLADIADQLDRQMNLLTNLYRTAIPRHQTMQAALEWSFDLLTPPAQMLLARLSVFVGGWLLEGALAMAPEADAQRAAMLLRELVDKSLVAAEEVDGDLRYHMLEPVRQFAITQLRIVGEEELARQRMADHFMSLAELVEEARDSALEVHWLQRMQREADNVRAVNRWAIRHGLAEFVQRFNARLFLYHAYGSDTAEAVRWYDEALSLTSAEEDHAALEANASALTFAGYCASIAGAYPVAERYFQEAMERHAFLNDKIRYANSLRGLGVTHMLAGDLDTAYATIARALEASIDADDPIGTVWGRFDMAEVTLFREQFKDAKASYQAVLSEFRRLNIPYGVFRSLQKLAYITRELGEPELAHRLYREALSIQLTSKFVTVLAFAMEGLAGLSGEDGHAQQGVILMGAADSMRRYTGFKRYLWQESRYQRDQEHLRRQLDEKSWTEAWTKGRAMSAEEAVRFALSAGGFAVAGND